MKKQFFAAAMILALGAGFTACSNDDLGKQEGKQVAQNASTYMTVTFDMPRVNSTRATAADGQDKDTPDFNYLGQWSGQDKVTSFTLFVFAGKTADSKLEVAKEYSAGSFTVSTATGNAVVKPNEAFLVAPGEKRVFVVINPTVEVTTHLNATVGTTTLGEFEDKYKDAEFTPTWATSPLAKHVDAAGSGASYDNILMTGLSADKNIVKGVSSSEAVAGAENNVALKVQRAVAGVTVTSTAPSYSIKGMNADTKTLEEGYVTVSELSYVVGQTNKKLYLQQKANDAATVTSDGAAFKTPAYDYVPGDDYNTKATTYFDYSGLEKVTTGSTRKTNGLEVAVLTDRTLTGVTPKLPNVEFLLPTTHKYSTDRTKSGYRKGNSPYVLVRGYLTPQKYIDANGEAKPIKDLGQDADLFYGETTGLFYQNLETTQATDKNGVKDQKVRKFAKRVVLYWAWLNLDQAEVNSPVIRNNIYHIQITSIGNLGGNWNPLNPDPNNPDPKPNEPHQPDTPPIDPKDPLTLDKTWMSTNVTILPWQVHSREIELSI